MAEKQHAARLFSRAVHLVVRAAGQNGQSGRSEDDLRRYERKLKKLSREDPDGSFYWVLERANLKLLNYILRTL